MTRKFDRFIPNNEEFDLKNSPFYWISQVNNMYVQNLDRMLKPYGLDNSRRKILTALKYHPNASISDLSDFIVIQMSTTTKIIYRLKEEGFVDTYSCAEDGRITRARLTERGLEMVEKINQSTNAILNQYFKGLTPSQIEKTNEVLSQIFHNCRSY